MIAGCSPVREQDSDEAIDREVREALAQRVRSDVADDLGDRITDDRPIRHEFRPRNPTDAPIRLINATALKTCCSSIGPIPRIIPARGDVAVPVIWKVGHQAGRKRVQFVVATDRVDCRTIDLSLTANLLPAWEVSPFEGAPGAAKEKAASIESFRVITRRLGREGLSPPTGIDSTGPFRARFIGDATEEIGPGGVVESRGVVEVALAPGQGVGTYAGELRLKWDDGTSKTHPIGREIRPHVRSTPSTLVVAANDGPRRFKVVVGSDEPPFRILEVAGPALARPFVPGTDPARSHVLGVEVDPSRLDRSKASDVEIRTDHPFQASVTIRVFLVEGRRGDTP